MEKVAAKSFSLANQSRLLTIASWNAQTLTRWGSLVRTQYRAPFFLATLRTPQLNPQDTRIIDEIWSHNLSLVQIWESYKLVHLQASISLEEAIRRYTGWLRDNNRSPRYIQEICWVLEELRSHIGDHLTVAQNTTFLVVGALKKCRSANSGNLKKISPHQFRICTRTFWSCSRRLSQRWVWMLAVASKCVLQSNTK